MDVCLLWVLCVFR